MCIIPEWVDNSNFYEWRRELKLLLFKEREGRSDLSGNLLKEGCHMHEGIVSRAVVPRGIWWHYQIYAPFNCFLLLPDEHIPHPPSREWAVEKAYARYGKDAVQDWFYGLPWKVIPFRLLE